MITVNEQVKAALDKMASTHPTEAIAAARIVYSAVDAAIYKEQVLDGAVLGGVYASTVLAPGARPEYPTDILKSNDMDDLKAWQIPKTGKIPTRMLKGDSMYVATYDVGNSLEWPLYILKTAQYDIFARYMQVYAAGLLRTNNDDAMQTLLAAAKGRNQLVNDAAAGAGKFTKELVTAMQDKMETLGGGNTTSTDGFELTHMLLSPKALLQMRSWTLTDLPDTVRARVFDNGVGYLDSLWGTQFVKVRELGAGLSYALFYENLSGTDYATDDVEVVVGLDLREREVSFVNPIVEKFTSYPKGEATFELGKGGVWGRGQWAWAVLDDRYTLTGSY